MVISRGCQKYEWVQSVTINHYSRGCFFLPSPSDLFGGKIVFSFPLAHGDCSDSDEVIYQKPHHPHTLSSCLVYLHQGKWRELLASFLPGGCCSPEEGIFHSMNWMWEVGTVKHFPIWLGVITLFSASDITHEHRETHKHHFDRKVLFGHTLILKQRP